MECVPGIFLHCSRLSVMVLVDCRAAWVKVDWTVSRLNPRPRRTAYPSRPAAAPISSIWDFRVGFDRKLSERLKVRSKGCRRFKSCCHDHGKLLNFRLFVSAILTDGSDVVRSRFRGM